MKLRPVKYSPEYAKALAAKQAREAAIELRNRLAADAYHEARARGTMEPGEAALIAALSVNVPKAPQ